MTTQTKLQNKPSIEKREFDLFMFNYKNGAKYRGLRMGQAFYIHFHLHKMNHGPEYNKLYEMYTEEFNKNIHNLFTIH